MKEYIFLLVTGIVVLFTLLEKSESQLQLVVVWTRHGARGPMYDVLQNYYEWWTYNYEPEEITTVGQRQHLMLGTAMRRNYRFFLPEYFNESKIIVRSTESKRAVRSAQAFLMGMFPKASKIKQNEIERLELSLPPGYADAELLSQLKMMRNQILPFNFQPFPLTSPLEGTDPIMTPENLCPRVQQLRAKAFSSQMYKDFEQELWNSGFYDEFAKVFSRDLKFKTILDDTSVKHSQLNMTSVGWYYDSIVCDIFENRPLPFGLTDELLKKMLFVYDVQNLWKNFPNEEAIKLMASNSARSTLQNMNNFQANTTYKNVILYSGHDGNLITLLEFFGIAQPTFDFTIHENPTEEIIHTNPPFASSIVFELYRDPSSYGFSVRLIYNGQPRKLTFCQNPYECSLKEFENYIIKNTYDSEQWEQACVEQD